VTEVSSSSLLEVMNHNHFDIVLICFDLNSDSNSFKTAKEIELLLPNYLPRLFIATKIDVDNHKLKTLLVKHNNNINQTNQPNDHNNNEGKKEDESISQDEIVSTCESSPIFTEACQHCIESNLPFPLPTSSMKRLDYKSRELIFDSVYGNINAIPMSTSSLSSIISMNNSLQGIIKGESSLSYKLFKVLCIGAIASLTVVATSTLLKKYYGVETMNAVMKKFSVDYRPSKLPK
jgi:hypothetical protein